LLDRDWRSAKQFAVLADQRQDRANHPMPVLGPGAM
jgi:hypothetical protein